MRFLVSTLFFAIGESDAAIEHLRRTIGADPRHAKAHYLLGVLLRDQRSDWLRADYHFRQYLDLEPSGVHAAEARASLLESVR
jgi:Flp pilus assembly protein TadD